MSGNLERQRLAVVMRLINAIERPVKDVLSMGPCSQVTGIVYCLQELQYQPNTLWPVGQAVEKMSISEILKRMERFQDKWNQNCDRAQCRCRSSEMSVGRKLREEREAILEWKPGVCLDCLRTQGESATQGRCRVSHRPS